AFQFRDLPVAHERRRFLFPRSCMNERLEPFVVIGDLSWQQDRLSVLTWQHLDPPDASLYYELDASFHVLELRVGSSFERIHLQLRANRILDHDLAAREIDALRTLTDVTAN